MKSKTEEPEEPLGILTTIASTEARREEARSREIRRDNQNPIEINTAARRSKQRAKSCSDFGVRPETSSDGWISAVDINTVSLDRVLAVQKAMKNERTRERNDKKKRFSI